MKIKKRLFNEKFIFKAFVFALAVIVSAGSTWAGNKESNSKKTGLFKVLWSDFSYTVSSVTRIKKKDLLPIGAFVAVTGTVVFFDEDIRNSTENNNKYEVHTERDKIFGSFEPLGNGMYLLPSFAGLYAGGWLFENDKMQETATMATESFLITGALTLGFKHLISRERPRREKGAYHFGNPKIDLSTESNSFPSGHTATAFSTATVIAEQYDNLLVKASVYSLASLVAMQRVYSDAHWASDVLVGAALGILVGKSVVYNHKKWFNVVGIYPEFSPNKRYAGVMFNYRF